MDAPNHRVFCNILADARQFDLPGSWSGIAGSPKTPDDMRARARKLLSGDLFGDGQEVA